MRNSINPYSIGRPAAAVLLLLALLTGARADQAPLTPDEVAQKVEAAQDSAKDVQMDLDMQMKDPLSGQTQQVKGAVKLKSPDLIYVHSSKPTEQFLYVDGASARMYQPAQHMVYVQKAPQGAGAGPLYLGMGRELKRYIAMSRAKVEKDSDDEVVLDLRAKSEDASFTRMEVTIRKKDWWPVRVKVETVSLITQAQFSNFVFDQGLDGKLFEFTAPKDAEVEEGAVF